MGNLNGKVAVITGAGGGIGREIALELAKQGIKLVINDYGVAVDGSEPKSIVAEKVAQEINNLGGEAIANAHSIAEMKGAENLINTAINKFGDLDILVCVAGILRERMIFNMSEEEWDSVINVHLKGHFAPMHFATKHMRAKKKGRIITFTSAAGLEGSPGQPNYSAAKAGIVGLSMSTALAMGKYNVTCNVISPNADTRMTSRLDGTPNAALLQQKEDLHPRHIAPLVAYLSSDDAEHITGQILEVKGREISLWSHHQKIRSCCMVNANWTVEKIHQMYDGLLGQDKLRRFESLGLKLPGSEKNSIITK